MKYFRVEAVLAFCSQFPDGDVEGDLFADEIADALEVAANALPCVEPGSVSVIYFTASDA